MSVKVPDSASAGIEARIRLEHPGFTLDVQLSLPSRGVSVLFGPSGCGKTSVLRWLAGLVRHTSGFLRVEGEVWQDENTFMPAHQRPLGYVFQDAALFTHLSVERNLVYGRDRIPVAQRRIDFDHVVQLLGLQALLSRMPQNLSGGERQRVAIARALLTSPRLLLLDEPLAALDAARKQEFLPYLEQLRDELNIPVIYVSHAPDEVARLADTLVLMREGRVVVAGPLTQTLSRLDVPLHLGEESGVVLTGVVGAFDLPWQLMRVDFDGGSLWIRAGNQVLGQRLRMRILARDVSVALAPVEGTSVQNCLPARVEQIAEDDHPAQSLVRLRVGASPLLSRLTRRAASSLELEAGKPVWVQVKAAALLG